MSEYSVDVEAMQAAVVGIEQTVDVVSEAGIRGLAPPAEAVGDARLADALAGFFARWEVGVASLCKDAAEIVLRLRESAAGYEVAERRNLAAVDGPGPRQGPR